MRAQPPTSRFGTAGLVARAVLLSALGLSAAASTPAQTFPRDSSGATPAFTDPSPAAAARPVAAPADLRIVVNVPAYRLDAYLGAERVGSWPVTIGAPHNPTPDGRYAIETVIWNPWWHPPAHRRPKDKVTPPGPNNPMGRVKLNFAGLYYVHGTALTRELGRPTSRGCLRMANEDVMELARLVHRHAGGLDPEAIDRLAADPRRTRHLTLERPVPVEIRYDVVEVRDDALVVHEDVYRQAGQPTEQLAVAALVRAGLEASHLDHGLLREALAGSPPLVVPLDDGRVAARFAAGATGTLAAVEAPGGR